MPTFDAVAKLGAPAIALLHCENWEIARVLQERLMAAGRTDMGAWDDRSPAFTEAGHARTYLYYARVAGCPIYVVHVTTKETIAEIEKAKAEGLTVYSEIGTHYLVLHKDAWKINVPLRDRATHETLWQALASGAIDCIGSDHVAHTRTRESMETGNVWTTISGFPSRIEGMLPMMLSEGVNKGRITIERLAQVASENPARIFGLYPKKGAILPGADADLIVVDLKRRAKITKDLLHTDNALVDIRRLGRHRLAGHDTGSRQRRHGMAGERTSRESYRRFRRTIFKAQCRPSLLIALLTTERSAIESVWLESPKAPKRDPKEFVDGSVIERLQQEKFVEGLNTDEPNQNRHRRSQHRPLSSVYRASGGPFRKRASECRDRESKRRRKSRT